MTGGGSKSSPVTTAVREDNMTFDGFLWLDDILDKLIVKHNVEKWEVEELFANDPHIRLRERGNRPGEDIYVALGQTDAGRYLFVVFIYKPRNQHRLRSLVLVTSAQDMEKKEGNQYERK